MWMLYVRRHWENTDATGEARRSGDDAERPRFSHDVLAGCWGLSRRVLDY